MTAESDAFRDYLERGDVQALRDAWYRVAPHLPQPASYEEAEITMHLARTASELVKLDARAYSHAWLTERAIPSQLPDRLRPVAERMHPRVVEAVGVAIRFNNPFFASAAGEIMGDVTDAINDAYASGQTDPSFVKQRVTFAHDAAMKRLFGKRG